MMEWTLKFLLSSNQTTLLNNAYLFQWCFHLTPFFLDQIFPHQKLPFLFKRSTLVRPCLKQHSRVAIKFCCYQEREIFCCLTAKIYWRSFQIQIFAGCKVDKAFYVTSYESFSEFPYFLSLEVHIIMFLFTDYRRMMAISLILCSPNIFLNIGDTIQYFGHLRSREFGQAPILLVFLSPRQALSSHPHCLCFAKVFLSHRLQVGNECGLGARQHSLRPNVHSNPEQQLFKVAGTSDWTADPWFTSPALPP